MPVVGLNILQQDDVPETQFLKIVFFNIRGITGLYVPAIAPAAAHDLCRDFHDHRNRELSFNSLNVQSFQQFRGDVLHDDIRESFDFQADSAGFDMNHISDRQFFQDTLREMKLNVSSRFPDDNTFFPFGFSAQQFGFIPYCRVGEPTALCPVTPYTLSCHTDCGFVGRGPTKNVVPDPKVVVDAADAYSHFGFPIPCRDVGI